MVRLTRLALACLVLGLPGLALGDETPTTPHATTEQVQAAVGHAIGYLRAESGSWLKTRKCAACHHVPMALWSLGEAGRQGYAIDQAFVKEAVESVVGSPEAMIASKLISGPNDPPDPRPIGKGVKVATAFVAVAARSLPPLSAGQEKSLGWIADEIIKKQRDDGSWEFFLSRPPINENETTDAAWLIMALQGEAGPDAPESRRVALAKAKAWLAGVQGPGTLQDQVFKVLLAARDGRPRAEMRATIDALYALQQPDGGWRQLDAMESDAYATGQTLYALALAGDTADRPEIRRGIDFLVATQEPDGSWPMTSRATPSGKPGSATLMTPITCAAGAWATLGLSRLVPKRP